MKKVLVIDGQGGRLGAQLVRILKTMQGVETLAIGTNSTATTAMVKAGADAAATGENALMVGCRGADVIVGPVGVVIADALFGEISPAMAVAVGQSPAKKILIPFDHCHNLVVGVADYSPAVLLEKAAAELRACLNEA